MASAKKKKNRLVRLEARSCSGWLKIFPATFAENLKIKYKKIVPPPHLFQEEGYCLTDPD